MYVGVPTHYHVGCTVYSGMGHVDTTCVEHGVQVNKEMSTEDTADSQISSLCAAVENGLDSIQE